MKIYYDSLTQNVAKFCQKLPYKCEKITTMTKTNEEFILITYTTGFGEMSSLTKHFLKNNPTIIAISSSGNKNWGDNYGKSADIIAKKFNLKHIFKFELQGTKYDVEKFIKWYEKIQGE